MKNILTSFMYSSLLFFLLLPPVLLAAIDGATASPPPVAASSPEQLFKAHCRLCHGENRLGAMGPALLPENLARLRKPEAVKTIAEGRLATQMPAFKDLLGAEEIRSLAEWIYLPSETKPVWDIPQIKASRIVHANPATLSSRPLFKADPLNLFIVVETGDHHATILDGDKLVPIHRFQTRFALHGGPKFSPDGRFVYLASRDGWISKFDIYNLRLIAEVRAGINTRNLAISGDGKFILVGNYLPHTVVVLNADDLSLNKLIPAVDASGKSSRVSAVYQAEPRKSFIVALKDVNELWEIGYVPQRDRTAWVHDYNEESGDASTVMKNFVVRRISTENFLDDFSFDPSYKYVVGSTRGEKNGQVIDLDAGKKIADISVPGLPHLGSAITWEYKGRQVIASPNLESGLLVVIDTKTWKTVAEIPTLGPGFFLRSHENTPYAWTDAMMGPQKDTLQIMDKRTLKIVKNITPQAGKTAAHIEFSQDGKYALASIWDHDGAIVVYDAKTFQEVKRLPMKKPSGKYNVYNKTRRSSGTSH